jgi:hypothetical protein
MFLCLYGNVLVTSFTVILRPLDYGTATRRNQSFREEKVPDLLIRTKFATRKEKADVSFLTVNPQTYLIAALNISSAVSTVFQNVMNYCVVVMKVNTSPLVLSVMGSGPGSFPARSLVLWCLGSPLVLQFLLPPLRESFLECKVCTQCCDLWIPGDWVTAPSAAPFV